MRPVCWLQGGLCAWETVKKQAQKLEIHEKPYQQVNSKLTTFAYAYYEKQLPGSCYIMKAFAHYSRNCKKMQLSSIRTTIFCNNCNDFSNSFIYG